MSNFIKLIVGLGNPNLEYTNTRHNIGVWYIKSLIHRYHKKLKIEKKLLSYISQIKFSTNNVLLLIPMTFMNLSGKSVAAAATFYNILPEEILVVHDELDLPPGTAKYKQGGGHAGHNGLKSIIHYMKNNNFYRLRIGIGHPSSNHDPIINFVLSEPQNKEKILIKRIIEEAICCTELWFADNYIKAINRLHNFKLNQ